MSREQFQLWPFYVLGSMLGIALVMILISLFQTFAPIDPPINVKVSNYRAIKVADGTIVVSYECNSEILDDFEAHIHRTATHTKTGLVISLPTNETQFFRGEMSVQRQFYIPAPAPSGEYCISSYMEWRPLFSLTDHTGQKRTACVEVK